MTGKHHKPLANDRPTSGLIGNNLMPGELLHGIKLAMFVHERIWPINCGAHQRIWQLINSFLALGASLELVALDGPVPKRGQWNKIALEHLRKVGIKVHLSNFGFHSLDFWLATAWHTWVKRIQRLPAPNPAGGSFRRPQLERMWRRILRGGEIQIAVINYANWHRLARIAREEQVWNVIEMHDLLIQQCRNALGSLATKNRESAWLKQFSDGELSSLESADCVFAINPLEASIIRSSLKVPVVDLPFCLPDTNPQIDSSHSIDILIVGSSIEHNKRGLKQFIDRAWPVIKSADPGVKLAVCGGVGEILKPDPNIIWYPNPSNLQPFYRDTAIVLLITVSGTGIKIKTIESLANACCIVAHVHSVDGIPFVDGVHGIAVEDLSESAPIILNLLASPSSQRSFREKAYELFRNNFQFERGLEIISSVIPQKIIRRIE